MTDHLREARDALSRAEDLYVHDNPAAVHALSAIAHALLALAEQQRAHVHNLSPSVAQTGRPVYLDDENLSR